MEEWNYEKVVEAVLHAPRFKVVPSVENMNQYLDYLNHPEQSFQIIHVAGTNGKGSTCSFLESILREKGYRTGLFTSPHLIDVRERMQINREMIEKESFVRAFLRLKQAEKDSGFPPMTFFEFILVMALLIFQEQEVDYAIIEAGMGGKSDATNALTPVLCIITAIGMDHMQYLGDTIEKIASEKAGILKSGIPCVAVDHKKEITSILINQAQKVSAPLYLLPEDSFKILKNTGKVIDFSVETRYYMNNTLSVHSAGRYQAENGAVAAVAAKVLFPEISDTVIEQGISRAFWPGRMEEVAEGVIVDGAHNEPSIEAFMNTVSQDGKDENGRILVFAVAADKDYNAMARRLLTDDCFQAVILTRIPYERMEDPEAIRPVFSSYTDRPIYVEESMEKAYEMALSMRRKEVIYLAGSLYFVGSLKKYLKGE